MKSVIPRRAKLVSDTVTGFDPDKNEVLTLNSGPIKYDYLVVSAGLAFFFIIFTIFLFDSKINHRGGTRLEWH